MKNVIQVPRDMYSQAGQISFTAINTLTFAREYITWMTAPTEQ